MLKRLLSVALIVALVSPLVGCGKKAPADFPKVVPFKVKVVDGGKGIANVDVALLNDKNPAVSGKTDGSGVAVISTTYANFTAKGAPEGEYKVTCVINAKVEHWKTGDEISAMSPQERKDYTDEFEAKVAELGAQVPEALRGPDTSTATVTVPAGGGDATIDVAEYRDAK